MILFVAEHWVHADEIEAAEVYLNLKASEQAIQPGFLRRYTVQSTVDATKFTTVTLWATAEDYDRWVKVTMPTLPSTGTFPWRRYWSEVSIVGDERLPSSP